MSEKLGIYAQRARMLARFFDLAEEQFQRAPETRSVMLACSQHWNDEADDAVQEETWSSSLLVPMAQRAMVPDVFELFRDWSSNVDAVWAFSAMCNEEGWTEEQGAVDPALKSIYLYWNTPLLIVQHAGDHLRATWLGSPLRSWLDFPDALQDRGHWSEPERNIPAVVPEPPMPELLGRERELYEQVLADPADRGARDVLRDVWIERGDPRGELCTVTGDLDNLALRARAAELIAAHGRSWVGALQPVIPLSGALFGYGPWIQKAIVYADDAALERVANEPAWSRRFASHPARPGASCPRCVTSARSDRSARASSRRWQVATGGSRISMSRSIATRSTCS